jgi:hypothetical protein
MTAAPTISVVLCTYNGERFLREQLDTIAAQSLPAFELIVCDDLSTDATLRLVEVFATTAPFPVRIHRNAERLGSTRNFEQGMRLATGALIAFCDQDDRWHLDKLAQLARIMQGDRIAGVFTDAGLIDDTGAPLPDSLWSRGHITPSDLQRFRTDPIGLLLRQDVATGATMILRSSVRDLYPAIPPEWVHDGWLVWMIVLHAGRIGRLEPSPLRLIEYRVHHAQQTGGEAARVGSRSDPLATRLEKARLAGHAHHLAAARRLNLVLTYWLDRNHGARDATALRLERTIALLEQRSSLPLPRLTRAVRILVMLPLYVKYGNGLRSAIRDLLA